MHTMTRTDPEIARDAVEAMRLDMRVPDDRIKALRRDAGGISISTQDGVVTLQGNVHSWLEKEEAARAAWGAPGVRVVVDHLAVVP
jgi:osmotically-inducible protein OsmY